MQAAASSSTMSMIKISSSWTRSIPLSLHHRQLYWGWPTPPPVTQSVGAVRQRSNRSRRGLYDGKDIRSGNNVSFSMKATKRKFKPNVFHKRVYSETLDEMIRFHLTTSALRSIDKFGGLDNYLLKSKHVTSGEGLKIKNRILEKRKLMEEEAKNEEMDVDNKT